MTEGEIAGLAIIVGCFAVGVVASILALRKK